MTPNFVLIAAPEGRFPHAAPRPRHRPLHRRAPNYQPGLHLRLAPSVLRLRSCPFGCSGLQFPNPESAKPAHSSSSRTSRSCPGQPRRAHHLLHYSPSSLRLLRSVRPPAPRRLLHQPIAPRLLRRHIPQRLLRRAMGPRPSATGPYRLPIHRSCRRRPAGDASYLQF